MKFLKTIDIFSQPVETFLTSRNRKEKSKEYKDTHGSIFGGILTIVCLITTFSYLAFSFVEMMNGENDNYNIQTRPNNMKDGQDQVFLSNSTLFPWLRMILNKGQERQFRVNGKIDFEALNKYISIRTDVRKRINGKIVGHYMIDYKECDDNDFIKRGIEKDKI